MTTPASAPTDAPAASAAPGNEAPAAAATPAAAPAATPVAPVIGNDPAPAATPPVASSKDDKGTVVFEPTDDPGLDFALSFIGKLGFDGDHPAVKAAEAGDFGLLKAQLAQLGDKAQGWEQAIALGEQALTRFKEQAAAKAKELNDQIIKIAGSEETWGKVKEWAGANADATEKSEINAALQQGGIVARATVAYLVQNFNRATGVTDPPKDAAPGAGSGTAANTTLSPRQYTAAVQELRAKLGGRMEGSREYADLQARRNAWRPPV